MTIYLALQILYVAALFATLTLVCRRGGPDELVATVALVLASAGTVVVVSMPSFTWEANFSLVAIVDLGLLAALLRLALRSRRFWPLWAAAFQLIAVSMHLLALITPAVKFQGYVLAQGIWAYGIMAAIIVGVSWNGRPPLSPRNF